MQQTFKDNYGDTATVTREEDNENLYLDVSEDGVGDACLSLNAETAAALGRALIGTRSADAEVRASEVSFNEGLMRLAAVHDKTVTFRYAKGTSGSVIESRRLQPESVFTNKQGDVLFGGQDPDRGEYRAYRVDRIKGEVTVA